MDIDVFALPVHPACEIFPWLDDENMDDLVESIREHGLLHPVLISQIDGEWMLIDGKNRREACHRAGVVPHFEVVDGDPTTCVISTNVLRKHLSLGQLAMGFAEMFPESDSGGRGHKSQFLEDYDGKPRKALQEAVRKARIVRRYAPLLVDRVRDGLESLDAAFQHANERYQAERRTVAEIEMLKRRAPDLAARVHGDDLELQEAIAICEEREREQRDRRAEIFRTFIHLLQVVQQAADRLADVADIPAVMDDPDYYAEFRDLGGIMAFEAETGRKLETVLTTGRQVTAQLRQWRRKKSHPPLCPDDR